MCCFCIIKLYVIAPKKYKYSMKMKQIDYQASQFIALQVGACLGLLTSLVGNVWWGY